mmetsp:Transcript_77037/g.221301  ORF Transcript_77037/g.221301 Transcript_77037/m.221301 type:complete len:278 (+) Transcript_77037:496-1329(+)
MSVQTEQCHSRAFLDLRFFLPAFGDASCDSPVSRKALPSNAPPSPPLPPPPLPPPLPSPPNPPCAAAAAADGETLLFLLLGDLELLLTAGLRGSHASGRMSRSSEIRFAASGCSRCLATTGIPSGSARASAVLTVLRRSCLNWLRVLRLFSSLFGVVSSAVASAPWSWYALASSASIPSAGRSFFLFHAGLSRSSSLVRSTDEKPPPPRSFGDAAAVRLLPSRILMSARMASRSLAFMAALTVTGEYDEREVNAVSDLHGCMCTMRHCVRRRGVHCE